MRIRWLALALLGPLFAVASVSYAKPESTASRWRTAMERELSLTQLSAENHKSLASLDRERASLHYTTRVLEHATAEGMRRLEAYRRNRSERERVSRLRALALYKLARGGAARLAFEELHDSSGPSRLLRGRLMRYLVRTDLHELQMYRTAETRAAAELVAASREQRTLAALGTVQAMQEHVLVEAESRLDPALATAHAQRRRFGRTLAQTQEGWIPPADLMGALRRQWHELRSLRGLMGSTRLVRPVGGRILARFGESEDPVYRLPVVRNGVELHAVRGEDVRALADGRVALISALPGYETVVVIDHGGGQYSLTGRLWDIRVAEGNEVEAGQVLGRVAPKAIDDGLGRSVYLELRHGEKPVDPSPYLRRAQAP